MGVKKNELITTAIINLQSSIPEKNTSLLAFAGLNGLLSAQQPISMPLSFP
jgi:hypothetical protein